MRWILLTVVSALSVILLGGAVIYSSTQTSAPSRSWCDGDSWDGGNVPGAADEARIVSEVVVDCDWTVGAVTIEEGGSLRWAGTATLTVDASAGSKCSANSRCAPLSTSATCSPSPASTRPRWSAVTPA